VVLGKAYRAAATFYVERARSRRSRINCEALTRFRFRRASICCCRIHSVCAGDR